MRLDTGAGKYKLSGMFVSPKTRRRMAHAGALIAGL
jgi:hypothetical protein